MRRTFIVKLLIKSEINSKELKEQLSKFDPDRVEGIKERLSKDMKTQYTRSTKKINKLDFLLSHREDERLQSYNVKFIIYTRNIENSFHSHTIDNGKYYSRGGVKSYTVTDPRILNYLKDITTYKNMSNIERNKNKKLVRVYDNETTRFRNLIEILATSNEFTSFISPGVSKKRRTELVNDGNNIVAVADLWKDKKRREMMEKVFYGDKVELTTYINCIVLDDIIVNDKPKKPYNPASLPFKDSEAFKYIYSKNLL